MKTLKFICCVLVAGFMISCGSENTEESETVITVEEAPEPEEDDGISFQIGTDEDGNVTGEVEGEIDTK